MDEVAKQVEFAVAKKPLAGRGRDVYKFILDCIKNKRVIDDYILQDWFVEVIVKKRNKSLDCKFISNNAHGWPQYEQVPEYEKRKAQIKENGLLPYWILGEAKQILKYHIGALVVKGYLVVLPVIKITDEESLKNELYANDK